ncbi:uncharacterized protein LOC125044830 [Penaeus chinensis]|uniref:uncharacterized protein LOC125044830 n=1 Tax=Penaeus chinensis TaxID=139456 RepID=UPI001FB76D73|nr:uncharacterized protein LOC125044830 [Penaeus chinensis]
MSKGVVTKSPHPQIMMRIRRQNMTRCQNRKASRMTSLHVQLILLCLLWHRTTATIQESAAAGDTAQVQTFLDNGVSVDDLSQGKTALTEAVENDQYAMVEFLLDAGADIDLARNNGRTPLMLAVIGGFYDIAVLLIERGADLEVEAAGQTAYSFAVTNGLTNIACYLQENGASTAGVADGAISGTCAFGETEYSIGDNWCENGTAVTCAGTCNTQPSGLSCDATSTVPSTVMTSTAGATTTVAATTTMAAKTSMATSTPMAASTPMATGTPMAISTLTPPATVTKITTEFQPSLSSKPEKCPQSPEFWYWSRRPLGPRIKHLLEVDSLALQQGYHQCLNPTHQRRMQVLIAIRPSYAKCLSGLQCLQKKFCLALGDSHRATGFIRFIGSSFHKDRMFQVSARIARLRLSLGRSLSGGRSGCPE